MKLFRWFFLAMVIGVGALVLLAVVSPKSLQPDLDLPKPQLRAQIPVSPPEVSPSPAEIPSTIRLAVPFIAQAPLKVWDAVHEETCEEAAIAMVHAYLQDRRSVSPSEAEEELLRMVQAEKDLLGFFEDTTAAQTVQVAESFYGYKKIEILKQPSVEKLKALLAAGNPVIVPTAGRILANPHFSGRGPLYHMIVLTGYTTDGFITNDPGTRWGEGWVYPFEHVMASMHDWVVPEGIETNPQDIPTSKKVAIVIYAS